MSEMIHVAEHKLDFVPLASSPLTSTIVFVFYNLPNTVWGGGGVRGVRGVKHLTSHEYEHRRKFIGESKECHTVMKFARLQPLGEGFC